MKKRIYLFTALLSGALATAQEDLNICNNGGFESGYTNYSFGTGPNQPSTLTCGSTTPTVPAYTPSGLDAFSNPVTRVTAGYDNTLAAFGINVSTVAEGEYAIKLNDNVNDKGIAIMSKPFIVSEPFVSYRYSLIVENEGTNIEDRPLFIVRLLRSGTIIAQNCIEVLYNDPTMPYTTQNGEYLYTDWQCATLSTSEAVTGERLILEFIMVDDTKGASFATVYIDDICNDRCPECRWCIDIDTDVVPGPADLDEQEAEYCINATNIINDDTTALYHAGYEVVLLPDFEALQGSTGRFYIEECSGEFAARQPQNSEQVQEQGLQVLSNELKIYPNPAATQLTIELEGLAITAVTLTALDGKLIFSTQTGNEKSYQIDMAAVAKGIYLLTVQTSNGNLTTHRIIKE